MKAQIVSYDEDNYAVIKEDGKYIGTFHSQRGLVPILWSKEFNSKQVVKERVEATWNITIVDSFEALTIMLEHGHELVEGEIIDVVDTYTDHELGHGYRVVKVVGFIEVKFGNGQHYIVDTVEDGFVSTWKPKE